MNIKESCELPLVFNPQDRVQNVLIEEVEDFPYDSIITAAFLRRNERVVNYTRRRGFKQAPESPWVPFRSSTWAPSSNWGQIAVD